MRGIQRRGIRGTWSTAHAQVRVRKPAGPETRSKHAITQRLHEARIEHMEETVRGGMRADTARDTRTRTTVRTP